MNMMESQNPLLRLVVFGKMKKIINSYNNQKITDMDRRLLRGLFIKKLKDFDEDNREKMKNISLIDRLKSP